MTGKSYTVSYMCRIKTKSLLSFKTEFSFVYDLEISHIGDVHF